MCFAAIARKVKRGSSLPIPVKEGDVLSKAKVDSVLRWGAFVDVGAGHRGLLHVDSMKAAEELLDADAKDIMKPGQTIQVLYNPLQSFSSQFIECRRYHEGCSDHTGISQFISLISVTMHV